MKTPTIERINVKRRSVLVSAVLGSIALATVRIVDAIGREEAVYRGTDHRFFSCFPASIHRCSQ